MIIDAHTRTFPERVAALAIDKMKRSGRGAVFSCGTAQGLWLSMKKAGADLSGVMPAAANPAKTASISSASLKHSGTNDRRPIGLKRHIPNKIVGRHTYVRRFRVN